MDTIGELFASPRSSQLSARATIPPLSGRTPKPVKQRLAWASALCTDTPTRSPTSVRKLTPHAEALLEESKIALAAAVSAMPELELASPPATATLNVDAAEWKPPPKASATSLNVEAPEFQPPKKKPMLSVDAPEFVPPVATNEAPVAEPTPAVVALRAQVQRMAHELEACQQRLSAHEASAATAQMQRREEREALERELVQTRAAFAAERAAHHKEQRIVEDLHLRLGKLSDEVCDLHEQKDGMGQQLAAQQRAWFAQRAECERLEARLRARDVAASMPQAPAVMAPTRSGSFNVMPPPAAAFAPPLPPMPPPAAPAPAAQTSGPALVDAVAELQREMATLRASTSAPPRAAAPVAAPAQPAAATRMQKEPSFEEGDDEADAEAEADEDDAPRVRTSRSRRGGRGKGKKTAAAAAAAAAAEALKENASNALNAAQTASQQNWPLGDSRRTLQQHEPMSNPHGRVVTIG